VRAIALPDSMIARTSEGDPVVEDVGGDERLVGAA
jgi:hypothetical protein